MRRLLKRYRFVPLISIALLGGAALRAAEPLTSAPEIPGASVRPGDIVLPDRAALRWSWHLKEHPSGIVHPAETCTLVIDVLNPAATPLTPQGILSITAADRTIGRQTIAAAPIAPGDAVEIEIPLHLAHPGTYRVSRDNAPILNSDGLTLRSIYPPRGKIVGSPLCAPLFPAALQPGVLRDFVQQTHCRRFVLSMPWALAGSDAASEMLPLPRAREIAARAAAAQADIILRIIPRPGFLTSPRDLAAFHLALESLLPVLAPTGLILCPPTDLTTAPAIAAYQSAYLAAYDAARRAAPHTALLGPGTARQAAILLNLNHPADSRAAYLDALAVADTPDDLVCALALRLKQPIDLLPPEHDGDLPAAVALSSGVATVPWAPSNLGVPLHLLGSAVLYQKIADAPVLLVTFQGDGYAVGVVALPPFTPSSAPATASAPAPPTILHLLDSNGLMRVVDAAGQPVDCRIGDALNLPLDRGLLYVLVTGSADDLTATLRAGRMR